MEGALVHFGRLEAKRSGASSLDLAQVQAFRAVRKARREENVGCQKIGAACVRQLSASAV